jgi:hypothetical protein
MNNIIPQLVAIEENENRRIAAHIKHCWGDVEAGLAIAEMIASMSNFGFSGIGRGTQHRCPNAVSTMYSFIAPLQP